MRKRKFASTDRRLIGKMERKEKMKINEKNNSKYLKKFSKQKHQTLIK